MSQQGDTPQDKATPQERDTPQDKATPPEQETPQHLTEPKAVAVPRKLATLREKPGVALLCAALVVFVVLIVAVQPLQGAERPLPQSYAQTCTRAAREEASISTQSDALEATKASLKDSSLLDGEGLLKQAASPLPLFFDSADHPLLKHAEAMDVLSSSAVQALVDEISAQEEKGYRIGFILYDVDSGLELSYNADELFYPASSIKGPYVTSLYQQLVESGTLSEDELEAPASRVLLYSDNDSYKNLRLNFTGDPFQTWLEAAGVSSGTYGSLDEYAQEWYPDTTPRQLLGMWQHIYAYLETHSAAADKLGYFLSQREVSALDQALAGSEVSWGKAGWYPSDEGSAYSATVDAGIVWSERGPYIALVMSDIPDDMEALVPIFAALDKIHARFAPSNPENLSLKSVLQARDVPQTAAQPQLAHAQLPHARQTHAHLQG